MDLTGMVFGHWTDNYGDGPCPLKEKGLIEEEEGKKRNRTIFF